MGNHAWLRRLQCLVVVTLLLPGCFLLAQPSPVRAEALPAWAQLAIGPGPRYAHTAVYDSTQHRMIVLGGLMGPSGFPEDFTDKVWALSLGGSGSWSELVLAGGPKPPARYETAAIFDPEQNRIVVFGGWAQDRVPRNDVWALNLAGTPTWQDLTPVVPGPSARIDHAAIYDPVNGRMIVTFGLSKDPVNRWLNDVWALSLRGTPTWSQIVPQGSGPARRRLHVAVYDPQQQRMVLFGGDSDISGLLGDAWALSLEATPTWRQIAATGPTARYGAVGVYDELNRSLVLFGGTVTGYRNDAWALSLGATPTWSALQPGGALPTPRAMLAGVYDPVAARLVVYGGDEGGANLADDTWGLFLSPGIGFSTANPVFCTPIVVDINLSNVADLYGYQFKVGYDPAKVSVSGALVTSWFGDAYTPGGWDGACSAGTCRFAATKSTLYPGPVSGGGPVGRLTLTPLAPGAVTLSFSEDILSDRDGMAMAHAMIPLNLTIQCQASVSGRVRLQGRATPLSPGFVTLHDLGGQFDDIIVPFDATTGDFAVASIPLSPGGSNYQLDATHALYLGNRMTHLFGNGDVYVAATTKLLGGDADLSGRIDMGDIGCIAGSFGGTPIVCGASGSSDINADASVNILDLVLAAGNYDLATPQPW